MAAMNEHVKNLKPWREEGEGEKNECVYFEAGSCCVALS